MFVDIAAARRIEEAEARLMREMVGALADSFVMTIDGGVAAFVRPGSPMNKVIAVGMGGPIAGLDEIERVFREKNGPVRIELATLAAPEAAQQLSARGYRLMGFENVLARRVTAQSQSAIRVEAAPDLSIWKEIVVDGFAHSDDTGAPADHHTLEAIREVIEDSLATRALDRYLAYCDGIPAGAASMGVQEKVVILTGSATLPAYRRRGLQAALIARRLDDAAARGAELAVITTAPGTQSQANVMKLGFALVYSRAILVSTS